MDKEIEEVVDKILRVFYPTYENIPLNLFVKYKIQIKGIIKSYIHSLHQKELNARE